MRLTTLLLFTIAVVTVSGCTQYQDFPEFDESSNASAAIITSAGNGANGATVVENTAPAAPACIPSAESCNGIDDNCNGQTDEGLVRECGTSLGVCRKGNQTCTNGIWSNCSSRAMPSDEACNGQDDDCDGQIDENVTTLCGSGVGECRPGTVACVNGAYQWNNCVGGVGPATEICGNGMDEDCDGVADDNCGPPPSQPTGASYCQKYADNAASCVISEGGNANVTFGSDYYEITNTVVRETYANLTVNDDTFYGNNFYNSMSKPVGGLWIVMNTIHTFTGDRTVTIRVSPFQCGESCSYPGWYNQAVKEFLVYSSPNGLLYEINGIFYTFKISGVTSSNALLSVDNETTESNQTVSVGGPYSLSGLSITINNLKQLNRSSSYVRFTVN